MIFKYRKLEDIVEIKYGKSLKSLESGNIPAIGSSGIQKKVNQALIREETIVIGRKGTLNNPQFYTCPIWPSDTVFYLQKKSNEILLKYIYYVFQDINLENFNEGTSIPSLRIETLKKIVLPLPSKEYQEKVINFLDTLHNKIELNKQINKNLEELARILFKAWFIDYIPFNKVLPSDWEQGLLGDFVDIKRGGSPRPIQNYLSPKGIKWLKISDVTKLDSPYILEIKESIRKEGLNKTVYLKRGVLVLSNSGTPGIPKILDIESCVHDGWLYFENSKFTSEYLYLLFTYIRPNLISLGNGSIFTNLKIDIVKNYPVFLPSFEILKLFNQLISPIFSAILSFSRQNEKLIKIRNIFLSKLLKGEIEL